MPPAKLTERQRRFLDDSRVGHLAASDPSGAPHPVPVCYAADDKALYITVDEKPKRHDIPLKRVPHPRQPASRLCRRPLGRTLEPARLGHAAQPLPRSSTPAPSTAAPKR